MKNQKWDMRKFMKKLALILVSAFLLSACSSGSASVTQSQQANSKLPPAPDRTANNATLAGISTSGTGVRDDVYRLVFNTYTSTVKRKIGLELANKYRVIYSAPPATTAEARRIADEIHAASDCLYSRKEIPFEQRMSIDTLVESSHADTSARMKAYLNYNHLLDGESFTLNTNANSCDGVLP